MLNTDPLGHFARPSEPLESTCRTSSPDTDNPSAGAIAHDGDADRLMAFDNRWRFISGDSADDALYPLPRGKGRWCTSFDASMAIEEVAEVRRTPVGDTFIPMNLPDGEISVENPSGAGLFPGHSCALPDGPYDSGRCSANSFPKGYREQIRYDACVSSRQEVIPCENAARNSFSPRCSESHRWNSREWEEGWFLVRAFRHRAEDQDHSRRTGPSQLHARCSKKAKKPLKSEELLKPQA